MHNANFLSDGQVATTVASVYDEFGETFEDACNSARTKKEEELSLYFPADPWKSIIENLHDLSTTVNQLSSKLWLSLVDVEVTEYGVTRYLGIKEYGEDGDTLWEISIIDKEGKGIQVNNLTNSTRERSIVSDMENAVALVKCAMIVAGSVFAQQLASCRFCPVEKTDVQE